MWKDTSDNEEGFVIEEQIATGKYVVVAIAPPNTEQVRLKLYAPVPIRVRAWNAGGVSGSSQDVLPRTPTRRRVTK
ncbi:MAG TPA: hypothetical protein VF975_01830 [Thermoanaerobaculia bacterium]